MNFIILRIIPLIFIFSLLINIYATTESEGKIFGNVYDAKTGQPLLNANVYLSNTLFGSSTNSQGYFEIKSIPPGMHELVVSIIGYKFRTKNVWIKKDTQLKLNFRLQPVLYQTSTIEVEATTPDEWLGNLEKFKSIFFGKSEYATECQIKNPEVLDFNWKNGLMTAKARMPITIINRALGFKINCLIDEFYFNKSTQRWGWSIKPRFISLEDSNEIQQKIWNENRENVYLGSVYHFFKSMMEQNLKQEGFDIFNVRKAGVHIPRGELRSSIIDYKSLVRPGITDSEKILEFKNYLLVVYLKEFYSWIRLRMDRVTLNIAGYPEEPDSFEVFGEWAKSGVADILPMYLKEQSK